VAIFKHAYDFQPTFDGAVVRTWSCDYGEPEGLDHFATAWDEAAKAFVDILYDSERFGSDGVAYEDATPEVLARWNALSESGRATPARPMPRLSRKGERCV